jgi:hypothetical protein
MPASGSWLAQALRSERSVRPQPIEATTTLGTVTGRRCVKPLEHLGELAFERLEFGNLMLHGAQLLGHEGMKSRTNT